MTKKRTMIKRRRLPATAQLSPITSHGRLRPRQNVKARLTKAREGPTSYDQGFSLSVTVSPSAIRYVSWLLGALTLLAACWYAPDAAVLAGKLKAMCEVLKL